MKEQKCGNPICNCPAPEGGDYCSAYCSDPESDPEMEALDNYRPAPEAGERDACFCEHAACRPAGHTAGVE